MSVIIHIISSLNPQKGGPTRFVEDLASQQVKLGHRVSIFTLYDPLSVSDSPNILELRQNGIKIFREYGFTPYMISIRQLFALLRAARSADVIHIHSLYRFLQDFSLLILPFLNSKVLFSPHGALDPYLYSRANYSLFGVLCKRFVELCLAKSFTRLTFHFTTNDEKRLCAISRLVKKSVTIPIGIHPFPQPVRKTLGGPVHYIGYIGRFHFKKNLPTLIKAFAQARSCCPTLKLVLAGPSSTLYLQQLHNLVNDLDIKQHVEFLPHLNRLQVYQLLSKLHFFALPSYSENFGISVLEALSSGTPVITSPAVNLSTIIKNYTAGIIVNPEPEALSNAICRLIQDPVLYSSLSSNALCLSRSEFQWHELAPRYSSF